MINYAFKRVYVKESLASVVEKVGGVRRLGNLPCRAEASLHLAPR